MTLEHLERRERGRERERKRRMVKGSERKLYFRKERGNFN